MNLKCVALFIMVRIFIVTMSYIIILYYYYLKVKLQTIRFMHIDMLLFIMSLNFLICFYKLLVVSIISLLTLICLTLA